jgi:hypothetical protein
MALTYFHFRQGKVVQVLQTYRVLLNLNFK